MKRTLYWVGVLCLINSVTANTLDLTLSAFRGSECDSSDSVVLAGSMVQLWVTFKLDPNEPNVDVYGGCPGNWQDKVSFTFGGCDVGANQKVALSPQPIRFFSQKTAEWYWDMNPKEIPESLWRRDMVYNLLLPNTQSECTLEVSIELNHEIFGTLKAEKRTFVIQPALDIYDSLQVLRSQRYAEYLASHFKQAFAMSDSMYHVLRPHLYETEGYWEAHPQLSRFDFNFENPYDTGVPYNVSVIDQYTDIIEPFPNPLCDYQGFLKQDYYRKRGTSAMSDDSNIAKLEIDFGKSCLGGTGHKSIYAGMKTVLMVTWEFRRPSKYYPFQPKYDLPVYSGIDYQGVAVNWPPGLAITAGYLGEDSTFTASEGLWQVLRPKLVIDPRVIEIDSIWRYDPEYYRRNNIFKEEAGRTQRRFKIEIEVPENLAGQTLGFIANYDHEKYGKASSLDCWRGPVESLTVLPIQNAEEERSCIALRFQHYFETSDYQATISLTDSVLPLGIMKRDDFWVAKMAARKLGLREKQYAYVIGEYEQIGFQPKRLGWNHSGKAPRLESGSSYPEDARCYFTYEVESALLPERINDSRGPNPSQSISMIGTRRGLALDEFWSAIAGTHHHLSYSVRSPYPNVIDIIPKSNLNIPLGYSLEIAATESLDEPFLPDSALFPLLGIAFPDTSDIPQEYWIDDGEMHEVGNSLSRDIILPESLVGKFIRFRAAYLSPNGWSVESPEFGLKVVKADRPGDEDLVAAQEAFYALRVGNNRRVINIADSALAAGQTGAEFLLYGMAAASVEKEFAKAYNYIVTAYKENGYLNSEARLGKPFSSEQEEYYKKLLYSLMRQWSSYSGIPEDHEATKIPEEEWKQ